MTNAPLQLIRRYRSKGLLLDANMLLLLLVGRVDRHFVQRFKRTNQFTAEDYNLLRRFVAGFKTLVTTPNILTEVNSLAGQLTGRYKAKFFTVLAKSVESVLQEHYVPSTDAVQMEAFPSVGLTDAGIAHLVPGRYLVLTDDLELAGRLPAMGADALNFNHLRWMSWR